MTESGFRVWYDNGIEAGSEWPEYIAERLMSCSVVIALMSKHAQDSQRKTILGAINPSGSLKKSGSNLRYSILVWRARNPRSL
ncbi:MAG: toll/interleukin-1 receptor domain-containing protein [Clostridia bacterium]|nr:toll/interleukin-1 receptor domain-containing protein [Clostridia bacterium]